MKRAGPDRILAVLAVIVVILSGGGMSLAAGLDQLREGAAKIKTIEAGFTQEKHLAILVKPLVSKGRFYYQAPDRIRWEYLDPIKSVMLMDKDRADYYLWSDGRWNKEAGQSAQVRQVIMDEIAAWMSGRFDQTKGFEAVFIPGPPARIVLNPEKEMKGFIEKIEITLSSIPGVIESVEVAEGEDARTIIRFSDVKVNKELKAGVFEKP